jgi:hypothetical protein
MRDLKVDCDEDGVGGDDAADCLRYLVPTRVRTVTQRKLRGRECQCVTLVCLDWRGWGKRSPSLPLLWVRSCLPEVSTSGIWQVNQ